MDSSERGQANDLRGAYGEWLVHSIASSAGLSPQKPLPDRNGVDVEIRHTRRSGFPLAPYIEVQIKTEANPRRVGDSFRVSLKQRHHDLLCGTVGRELIAPRYLVLVIAPLARAAMCEVLEDHVCMHQSVYWTSLMGDALCPTDQESTTVSVPASNLLTPRELFSLVVEGDQEEVDAWMSA